MTELLSTSPISLPIQRGSEQSYPGLHAGAPVADFEAYREVCDANNPNYRRVGLTDPNAYEGAVNDERTIFIAIGGCLMPAVIPMNYDNEFDTQRSAELMDDADPLLLTIPVDTLAADGAELITGRDVKGHLINLVATQDTPPLGPRESLQGLSKIGPFQVKDFIHPGIEKPDHQTAWLALYSTVVQPRTPDEDRVACQTFNDAWEQRCSEMGIDTLPSSDSNGAYLFSGEQLRQQPDIVDELWSITEVGFGDVLGAHHPLSMEEGGKEVFEELFLADNTYTIVHYADGKPICFGALTFDAQNWPWLNPESDVIQQLHAGADERGEVPVYFSALAGDTKSAGSSASVLSLAYELTGRVAKPVNLVFESTNLSSLYVPRLVEILARRSEYVDLEGTVRELGRVSYLHVIAEA